jgi:hypothetical protein
VFVDDGQSIRGATQHHSRLYVRSVPRHEDESPGVPASGEPLRR